MADVDLYGDQDGGARQLVADSEAQFLQIWEPEIKRAAKARALGRLNRDYEADELAQRARIRLMQLYRAGKSQAVSYVRTAIANAMNTVVPSDHVLSQAEEILEDAWIPADDQFDQDHLAAREVTRWVGSLAPQLQSTYELLYVEDLTQRETAIRMKLSQPRIAQLRRTLIQMGTADLRRLAA